MPLRDTAAEHLRCRTCQLCSDLVATACQHCIVAGVMPCQHSLSENRGFVQARSCRSCRRSGSRSLRSRRRVTCCSCRRDGRMRFSTCGRGLGWRRSSSSRTGSGESGRRNQYNALVLAPIWRHAACKLIISVLARSRQEKEGLAVCGMPRRERRPPRSGSAQIERSVASAAAAPPHI